MPNLLATRGTGILETHVEWSEIEQRMQEALHTKATFGPEKTVKDIGAGKGFLSRIALIHPDWQNGSDDLPKAFIAKICCYLSMIDFCNQQEEKFDIEKMLENQGGICDKLHNEEIRVYELLKKYTNDRIPLPKIYATRRFSETNKTRGYILMNFLEDLVPVHITEDIPVDKVKEILRYIAIWQGMGSRMTTEEREGFQTNLFAEMFGKMMDEKAFAPMLALLHKHFDDTSKETIDKLDKYFSTIIGMDNLKSIDSLPESLGMKSRVFAHGDLWSTNMLWSKQEGNYILRSVIDFQTSHFGCPAADVTRLICSSMSGEDRREHWEELLETFYGFVEEEYEGEVPYTLEQLKTNCQRLIPFGGFMIVPLAVPMLDYIAKFDPERAAEKTAPTRRKVIHLLEDMVACHEKNIGV